MRQFYYNQLRNNKIKSIALGALALIVNVLILYLFTLKVRHGENISIFHLTTISFIGVAFIFLFGFMGFGQVLEVVNETKFVTYYRLGRLRIKYRSFNTPTSVTLEQDRKKYYLLTIKMTDGQSLALEKHATLKQANDRITELKTLFY